MLRFAALAALLVLVVDAAITVPGFKRSFGYFPVNSTIEGTCTDSTDFEVADFKAAKSSCQSKPTGIPKLTTIGTVDGDTFTIQNVSLRTYEVWCTTSNNEELPFIAMTYKISLTREDNGYSCSINYTRTGCTDRDPTNVRWKKNGEIVEGSVKKATEYIEIEEGVRGLTSRLDVDFSNPSSGGEYVCEFYNKTDKTEWQILSSKDGFDKNPDKPAITFGPDASKSQYKDGDKVIMTCNATGYPEPSLSWTHDGKPITEGVNSTKVGDYVVSSFEINNLEDTVHRGNYTCWASSDIGNSSASRFLHIRDKLAPLWPFLGILIQVIVLAICIFIGEKFRKKKVAEKKRRKQLEQQKSEQPSTSAHA